MVATASGCDLLPYGRVNEFGRESFEQLLRVQPQLLRDGIAGLRLPADAVVILDTPPGPSVYLSQALTIAKVVLDDLLRVFVSLGKVVYIRLDLIARRA